MFRTHTKFVENIPFSVKRSGWEKLGSGGIQTSALTWQSLVDAERNLLDQ